MREQLNFRAFSWLLAGFTLLAVGLGLLRYWQVHRNAAEVRELARRAEEKGRLDRAARFLNLYLSFSPNDVEAKADYAMILEKMASTGDAFARVAQLYDDVLTEEPERDDVRKHLVWAQIRLGRYEPALAQIDQLLKRVPEDRDLTFQRGLCQEGLEKYPLAAEAYQKTFDKFDKSFLPAYVRLAEVQHLHSEKPGDAAQTMNDMVAANARSSLAYLLRARYRLSLNRKDAEDDLQIARQLAPEDTEILLTSAESAQLAGKDDQAREYLQKALKTSAQDDRGYLALARLEAQSGHVDRAVTCLKQGLIHLPGNAELLLSLASYLLYQGDLPAVHKAVDDIHRWRITNQRLVLIEAELHMAEGRWMDARNLLESKHALLRGESSQLQGQANLLLGQCYQQLGENERELTAFRRAADASPQNEQAQTALAQSLVRLGHRSEAIEQYRKLVDGPSKAPPSTWLTYAQLRVVERLSMPPGDNDWDAVERDLAEAGKRMPGSLEISLLWADVRSAQPKRASEAREILNKAVQQHPRRVEAWVALASYLAQQGKPPEAKKVLQDAEEKLGPRVNLDMARLELATKEEAASSGLVETIEEHLKQYKPTEQVQLLETLANSYVRWQSPADALEVWQRVIQQSPQNLTPRFQLFDLAAQLDRLPLMKQMVEQIEEIEGRDGPLGHYGEAILLLTRARQGQGPKGELLSQAREHLLVARLKRPDWPHIPAALGMVAEQREEREEALHEYMLAVQQGERRVAVIRQAVQLLTEYRRFANAQELIQRLKANEILSSELQKLAAEVSLHTANPRRALQQALAAVPKDTKSYKDLIWLAQVQASAGEEAEAKASLRKAIELAGPVADPWVALVQYHVYLGQRKQAEEVIAEARRKLEGKQQAHLALARCWEAVGRAAQAEAELRAAVQASPEDLAPLRELVGFYQRTNALDKAIPVLKQLEELARTRDARTDLAWARRSHALCLATHKDDSSFKEAQELIDANLEDAEHRSVLDQYARVRVLESRPEHRQEALAALQQLFEKPNLSAEQQMYLALLQARLGEWPKARQKMMEILSHEGENPAFVEAFASQLIAHGEFSDVELWLDRLDRLAPKAASPFILRARQLGKLDRGQEAIPLARKFIAAAKDAADRLARRHLAAELLEQIAPLSGQARNALMAAAEEIYRQAVSEAGKPAETLALAAFLGRQQRFNEAMKLWQEASKKCSREEAAMIGTSIVCAGKPRTEHLNAVEELLQTYHKEAPRSPVFLKLQGMLQAHRDRYADAEQSYQEVLRQDPRDSDAMNNLALMLVVQDRSLDDADRLLKRAMELAGATANLMDTRGMLNLKRKRLEEAVRDFQEAVAQDQEPDPLRLLHLARALSEAQRQEEARELFRKAQSAGVERSLFLPADEQVYQDLLKELRTGENARAEGNGAQG